MSMPAAYRRAFERVVAFGAENLLDDRIKPREQPTAWRHQKDNRWARIDEPDTRILELHEWPENTILHLEKLIQEAQDPNMIKPLLLEKVRARQTGASGQPWSRMVRECYGKDLTLALEEIRAENAAASKKRKQRANTPLQDQNNEDDQPPTKRHQSQSRPTMLNAEDNASSSHAQISAGPSNPVRNYNIQFGDLPHGSGDAPSSANVELPAGLSSTTLHASVRATTLGSNTLTAHNQVEAWVNPLHNLLEGEVKRLEEIKQTMGPNENNEAEEAVFASHLIASCNLGNATHTLDTSSSQAFFDFRALRIASERTQLAHLRTVLEESVRKLSTHIREHPTLRLSEDLANRITAVLG